MRLAIKNYKQFGGKHWETAAMRNVLAHAGVVAPHTGKPLTEAACLGIAGGIGIGYSFCPSIPKHDLQHGDELASRARQGETVEDYQKRLYACGSGLAVVGRHRVYVTGGDYYDDFFRRIGAKTTIKESTGVKAAHKNLVEALEARKPAIVWCAPARGFYLGWNGTYGMYSLVVHGIDEEKDEAYVGDRAPDSVTFSLEDLTWLRNRVCSHKNRLLTFDAPKKLDRPALKKAMLQGIDACVSELLSPRMKTFGFPGLMEWSKVINNPKNQKGWPKVYPGGRAYLPLRDVFDSIETAGTGGGLFRPMFADFLDEAAEVTGKKAIAECAERYRQLAKQWSELADAVLPSAIKPFKRTKELLRKRTSLFEQKGQRAIKQLESAIEELGTIEVKMRRDFALDETELNDLLEAIKERIPPLHDEELAAAEALKKAAS